MGSIGVSSLGKAYKYYPSRWSRLAEWLLPSPKPRHTLKWILHDIDFEVTRGETVGIIGVNGAGKSTLLKLITGTVQPTCGSIDIQGRVAAILELGMGFHADFTGRQNVFMAGQLLGMSTQEIARKMPELEAFADIGEYIDQPVRVYSSGMMMRLAFAVEILCDPDILIIDEALSVGDFFFQQKCLGHIRKLCERGVTLLFISHDMGTVRNLCSRVLYLRHGQLHYDGPATDGITMYFKEQNNAAAPAVPSLVHDRAEPADIAASPLLRGIQQDALWVCDPKDRRSTGKLLAVAVYDQDGRPATSFVMGSRVRIAVEFLPDAAMPTHVAIGFYNKYNQVMTITGSAQLGIAPLPSANHMPLLFDLCIDMALEAGNYSMIVTLGYEIGINLGQRLDQTPALGPMQLTWDYHNRKAPFIGLCGLPAQGAFLVRDARAEP